MGKNVLTHGKKQKALALLHSGNLLEARELLKAVCERDRSDAEAWLMRGVVCGQLGDHAGAAQCFRVVAGIQPLNAVASYNLGTAELNIGQTGEAESAFRRATEINPKYPEALASLSHVLLGRGALDEAANTLRQALTLRPDHAEWHVNLGAILQTQGALEEAGGHYRRALSLRPGLPFASDNLGSVLAAQGRTDEAIAICREGLRSNPRDSRAHSNLLLTLNYLAGQEPAQVFAEHCHWGKLHDQPGADDRRFSNPREPGRRLRVGYLSPDFRAHSVAYFIEPVLSAHDRSAVEVYCYADVARPDAVTGRLKDLSNVWRPISGRSDAEVVAQICADQIDVLVDLAGHTAGNRLPVFAQRVAPVQVTWLGYPNTTGLRAMDYRLTDAIADPPGQEAYYTEQLIRLEGCFLCYQPPFEAPAVTTLPASNAGYVTFGSFNNLAKIQSDVIAVWAELLHLVPGARLLIKNPSLTDASSREWLHAAFDALGVVRERIELLGRNQSQEEHLGLYGKVDIALDTFPYNGTTTTCEALWMGVPVVTLVGQTHASRVGLSLLTAAGLGDLAAETPEEYVARCTILAADIEALGRLRGGLRERVRRSSLCDAPGFTRILELALRGIWQRWCGVS